MIIPIRIRTKYRYKNYPDAPKATRRSKMLGMAASLPSTLMCLLFGCMLSALIFMNFIDDDAMMIASIIAGIAITLFVRLVLLRVMDKKNDEAALRESMYVANMSIGERNEYERGLVKKSSRKLGCVLAAFGAIILIVGAVYYIGSLNAIDFNTVSSDEIEVDKTYLIEDFFIVDKYAYTDDMNYYLALIEKENGEFAFGRYSASSDSKKGREIADSIEAGEPYRMSGYFSSYKSDDVRLERFYSMAVMNCDLGFDAKTDNTEMSFKYLCALDEPLWLHAFSGGIIIILIMGGLFLIIGLFTYVKNR